jgi:hypothetical protein
VSPADDVAAPPRPRGVTLCVRLMWLLAGIWLASGMTLFPARARIYANVARVQAEPSYTGTRLSPTALHQAVDASVIQTAILYVVLAGAYVFLAWKLGVGRRWARVLVLILAAVAAWSALATIPHAESRIVLVLAIAVLVANVALVALLTSRDARAWFGHFRAERPALFAR